MRAVSLSESGQLRNCPAPAKLNLFLHVTGRRADGYHLLQSLFQLVELGDVLHFQLRSDGQIRRMTDIPGVAEDDDLCVRAARLLQQAASDKHPGQLLPGAEISIEKNIPMGGGLGGGSSDAATTLLALNHLWQAGFSTLQLRELGLQLGADVPFFLFGHNAFVQGIGEDLQCVDTSEHWFIILNPGVSIPTAAIFSHKELTRGTKPITIADFCRAPQEYAGNDLQRIATVLFPEVQQALDWLTQFGNARMTGSGACVFCPFSEEHQADAVMQQLPPGWQAWKTRGLNTHPLAHLQKTEFV